MFTISKHQQFLPKVLYCKTKFLNLASLARTCCLSQFLQPLVGRSGVHLVLIILKNEYPKSNLFFYSGSNDDWIRCCLDQIATGSSVDWITCRWISCHCIICRRIKCRGAPITTNMFSVLEFCCGHPVPTLYI